MVVDPDVDSEELEEVFEKELELEDSMEIPEVNTMDENDPPVPSARGCTSNLKYHIFLYNRFGASPPLLQKKNSGWVGSAKMHIMAHLPIVSRCHNLVQIWSKLFQFFPLLNILCPFTTVSNFFQLLLFQNFVCY